MLVAHVIPCKCHGPAVISGRYPSNALEKGGRGSTTEQPLNTRLDTALGGGAKIFAETATAGERQSKTLYKQAEAHGYQTVVDAVSPAAVTDISQAELPLGLFADGSAPVCWEGPKASYHGNTNKASMTCTSSPKRDASALTLA